MSARGRSVYATLLGEPKSDSEPEPDPEPDSESEPESAPESEPEPDSESEPEPDTESEPEPDSESGGESASEPESEDEPANINLHVFDPEPPQMFGSGRKHGGGVPSLRVSSMMENPGFSGVTVDGDLLPPLLPRGDIDPDDAGGDIVAQVERRRMEEQIRIEREREGRVPVYVTETEPEARARFRDMADAEAAGAMSKLFGDFFAKWGGTPGAAFQKTRAGAGAAAGAAAGAGAAAYGAFWTMPSIIAFLANLMKADAKVADELKTAAENLENITKSHDKVKGDNDAMTEKLKKLTNTLEEKITNETTQLTPDELERLEQQAAENKSLRGEIADQESDLKRLGEDNDQMRQDLRDQEAEHKNSIDDQNEQIQKITDEIETKKAELDAKKDEMERDLKEARQDLIDQQSKLGEDHQKTMNRALGDQQAKHDEAMRDMNEKVAKITEEFEAKRGELEAQQKQLAEDLKTARQELTDQQSKQGEDHPKNMKRALGDQQAKHDEAMRNMNKRVAKITQDFEGERGELEAQQKQLENDLTEAQQELEGVGSEEKVNAGKQEKLVRDLKRENDALKKAISATNSLMGIDEEWARGGKQLEHVKTFVDSMESKTDALQHKNEALVKGAQSLDEALQDQLRNPLQAGDARPQGGEGGAFSRTRSLINSVTGRYQDIIYDMGRGVDDALANPKVPGVGKLGEGSPGIINEATDQGFMRDNQWTFTQIGGGADASTMGGGGRGVMGGAGGAALRVGMVGGYLIYKALRNMGVTKSGAKDTTTPLMREEVVVDYDESDKNIIEREFELLMDEADITVSLQKITNMLGIMGGRIDKFNGEMTTQQESSDTFLSTLTLEDQLRKHRCLRFRMKQFQDVLLLVQGTEYPGDLTQDLLTLIVRTHKNRGKVDQNLEMVNAWASEKGAEGYVANAEDAREEYNDKVSQALVAHFKKKGEEREAREKSVGVFRDIIYMGYLASVDNAVLYDAFEEGMTGESYVGALRGRHGTFTTHERALETPPDTALYPEIAWDWGEPLASRIYSTNWTRTKSAIKRLRATVAGLLEDAKKLRGSTTPYGRSLSIAKTPTYFTIQRVVDAATAFVGDNSPIHETDDTGGDHEADDGEGTDYYTLEPKHEHVIDKRNREKYDGKVQHMKDILNNGIIKTGTSIVSQIRNYQHLKFARWLVPSKIFDVTLIGDRNGDTTIVILIGHILGVRDCDFIGDDQHSEDIQNMVFMEGVYQSIIENTENKGFLGCIDTEVMNRLSPSRSVLHEWYSESWRKKWKDNLVDAPLLQMRFNRGEEEDFKQMDRVVRILPHMTGILKYGNKGGENFIKHWGAHISALREHMEKNTSKIKCLNDKLGEKTTPVDKGGGSIFNIFSSVDQRTPRDIEDELREQHQDIYSEIHTLEQNKLKVSEKISKYDNLAGVLGGILAKGGHTVEGFELCGFFEWINEMKTHSSQLWKDVTLDIEESNFEITKYHLLRGIEDLLLSFDAFNDTDLKIIEGIYMDSTPVFIDAHYYAYFLDDYRSKRLVEFLGKESSLKVVKSQLIKVIVDLHRLEKPLWYLNCPNGKSYTVGETPVYVPIKMSGDNLIWDSISSHMNRNTPVYPSEKRELCRVLSSHKEKMKKCKTKGGVFIRREISMTSYINNNCGYRDPNASQWK